MLEVILAVLVVVVAGFISWYRNVPIPPGFSQPKVLRSVLSSAKVHTIYTIILETLGIRTRLQSLRLDFEELKKALPKPSTTGLEIVDTEFDGVKVRVTRPAVDSEDSRGYPALVFIHGGGWVSCDVDIYDWDMTRKSKELQMVVLSVDYRLAPEVIFPLPFEDCLVATKYFMKNAHAFGANPNRVAIVGDSAGGSLAAAVALKLRDENFKPAPKRQVLIYPALQALDFLGPSYVQNTGGPCLTTEAMARYWSTYGFGTDKYKSTFLKNLHTSKSTKKMMADTYLNHELLGEEYLYGPYPRQDHDIGNSAIWDELKNTLMNPYFAPLMCEDLSGLPDTYIFTALSDPLRDDGLHYARRLQQAGVKVKCHTTRNGFHGVAHFIGTFIEADELFDNIADDLKQNL